MKNKYLILLTMAVAFLTSFQALIPSIPITNPETIKIISAVVIFLVLGLTSWKQVASYEITNSSLYPTLFAAVIAVVGGLNDLLNVVHFSDLTNQWIRFGITFIIFSINLTSKVLFPTPEAQATEVSATTK